MAETEGRPEAHRRVGGNSMTRRRCEVVSSRLGIREVQLRSTLSRVSVVNRLTRDVDLRRPFDPLAELPYVATSNVWFDVLGIVESCTRRKLVDGIQIRSPPSRGSPVVDRVVDRQPLF